MWGTVPIHVIRFEIGACHTGVKSYRFCMAGDAVCHIISAEFGAVLRFGRIPRLMWVVTEARRCGYTCLSDGLLCAARIRTGGSLTFRNLVSYI